MEAENRMPRVAFFLHPQALITSITMPAEMLQTADGLDRARRRSSISSLEVLTVTVDGSPIPAFDRMSIDADCRFSDLVDVDLLFLPSLFRNPIPALEECQEIFSPLRELAAGPTVVCGSGTGSWFAAEAGLLSGKPATTHWFYMTAFARRYPDVDLKRDHLITRSGNQYCTGSLNALADLTIHFIEWLYGPLISRHVAAQFSPEIRRPYRSQGFVQGEVNAHQDEAIVDAQQWLVEHLAEPVRMNELAERLEISQRSLNRRFREATGMSPVEYQRRQRVILACDLLSKSNFTVSRVGAEVGYPDQGYFSTVFRNEMAQSPSEYRRAVRRKLFSVDPE
jgi:transcriptional regulator GlxA family with amidase domain